MFFVTLILGINYQECTLECTSVSRKLSDKHKKHSCHMLKQYFYNQTFLTNYYIIFQKECFKNWTDFSASLNEDL